MPDLCDLADTGYLGDGGGGFAGPNSPTVCGEHRGQCCSGSDSRPWRCPGRAPSPPGSQSRPARLPVVDQLAFTEGHLLRDVAVVLRRVVLIAKGQFNIRGHQVRHPGREAARNPAVRRRGRAPGRCPLHDHSDVDHQVVAERGPDLLQPSMTGTPPEGVIGHFTGLVAEPAGRNMSMLRPGRYRVLTSSTSSRISATVRSTGHDHRRGERAHMRQGLDVIEARPPMAIT